MAAHRSARMSEHVPGWNLAGNETGASSDGDSGPQGAHVDPKPGNHPELGPAGSAERRPRAQGLTQL
jgi:hypothetical protein